jgi:hypothetical protein
MSEPRNDLQACAVCGRYFVKRPGEPICSMSCKLKAEEQTNLTLKASR